MDKLKVILLAAVVVLLGVQTFFPAAHSRESVGAAVTNPIASLTYTNVVTTSSAPTLLAAANGGRQYCVITNESANAAYFFINATSSIVTSSTASKASYLAGSGGAYEIIVNDVNLTGNVWGINRSGTSSLSIGCN